LPLQSQVKLTARTEVHDQAHMCHGLHTNPEFR